MIDVWTAAIERSVEGRLGSPLLVIPDGAARSPTRKATFGASCRSEPGVASCEPLMSTVPRRGRSGRFAGTASV